MKYNNCINISVIFIGEVCLPGGGREPGDTSPVGTALREAQEEIGLDPSLVSVVGVCPPHVAGIKIATMVSPVVCVLNTPPETLQLKLCEREVEDVYWMPVEKFLSYENLEYVKLNFIRGGVPINYNSPGFHHKDYVTGKDHFVWGLTARICTTLSAIILNRAPEYPYSENSCVSSIWKDGSKLRMKCHNIALTKEHLEQWKDYVNSVDHNVVIDKWVTNVVSKL